MTDDRKDLPDLEDTDAAVRALVDRTRTGKLRPEDMGAGSVTLSNLGGLGVDRFEALLFPPQALIMSVGTIRHRPADRYSTPFNGFQWISCAAMRSPPSIEIPK